MALIITMKFMPLMNVTQIIVHAVSFQWIEMDPRLSLTRLSLSIYQARALFFESQFSMKEARVTYKEQLARYNAKLNK